VRVLAMRLWASMPAVPLLKNTAISSIQMKQTAFVGMLEHLCHDKLPDQIVAGKVQVGAVRRI
jgi:hypothetical protein